MSVEQLPLDVVQNAICTRDENCTAQADEHDDECPVEARLREEFGY